MIVNHNNAARLILCFIILWSFICGLTTGEGIFWASFGAALTLAIGYDDT